MLHQSPNSWHFYETCSKDVAWTFASRRGDAGFHGVTYSVLGFLYGAYSSWSCKEEIYILNPEQQLLHQVVGVTGCVEGYAETPHSCHVFLKYRDHLNFSHLK